MEAEGYSFKNRKIQTRTASPVQLNWVNEKKMDQPSETQREGKNTNAAISSFFHFSFVVLTSCRCARVFPLTPRPCAFRRSSGTRRRSDNTLAAVRSSTCKALAATVPGAPASAGRSALRWRRRSRGPNSRPRGLTCNGRAGCPRTTWSSPGECMSARGLELPGNARVCFRLDWTCSDSTHTVSALCCPPRAVAAIWRWAAVADRWPRRHRCLFCRRGECVRPHWVGTRKCSRVWEVRS